MRFSTLRLAAGLAAFVVLAACGPETKPETKPKPGAQTDTAQPQQLHYLDQGWTDTERDWWYTVTQGSRVMPLKWAQALETANSEQKIFSDAFVQSYNFLTYGKTARNPLALPVGFAVDPGKDNERIRNAGKAQFPTLYADGVLAQDWVGFNCSTCHTNDIAFKGKTFRVDGAPTLGDFESFFGKVREAMQATIDHTDKFDRFSTAVLGAGASEPAKTALKAQLTEVLAWESALRVQNNVTVQPGFSRLDAQGHIMNKVALIVEPTGQTHDFSSDAPVSYPFIWNAPQHDVVQWNGIAPNGPLVPGLPANKPIALGALARNVGEVIGVFGHVNASKIEFDGGIASSIRTQNIIDIEQQLGKLRSPKWPSEFGALDATPEAKQ